MAQKTVVITGASDGVGRAIARNLAKSGYRLALLARNEERLKALVSELSPQKASYFVCDITDNGRVEQVIGEVVKKYGSIDVLVNDAGVWIEGALDTNKPEDILRALETNTVGHLYVTRAVIPVMKKQKDGLIINIVSQAGLYANPEREVYAASKWAMTGATKALEKELKSFNIRVTGIYPGKIDTKMFSKVGVEKKMEDAIPPEQVAEAVAFVVSRPKDVTILELGLKNVKN